MLYVMEHERKDVTIEGQAARAVAIARAPKPGNSLMKVETDEEAALALSEEGNEHNCPLCHEYFNTADFKAHAPQCIMLRAPRYERNRDRELGLTKVYRHKLFRGA